MSVLWFGLGNLSGVLLTVAAVGSLVDRHERALRQERGEER